MSAIYPHSAHTLAKPPSSRSSRRKLPAPLKEAFLCTTPSVGIPKPFFSPPLLSPANPRSRKLQQFFGDRVLIDGVPSKNASSGFLSMCQTWIPLCYFMRYCYRENMLQNLLCYLEIDRILSNPDKDSSRFRTRSEKIYQRFLNSLSPRLSFGLETFCNVGCPMNLTIEEIRAEFERLRSALSDLLTECYIRFEKGRFYCEMVTDLESNVQMLADLKVKALRHLDSDLGIFTHNFELLPNVDLLYQFRKNVLMVQPPNHFQTTQQHRSSKDIESNFVSSPLPRPISSPKNKNMVLGKLESMLSNFNSRDGYLRLDS